MLGAGAGAGMGLGKGKAGRRGGKATTGGSGLFEFPRNIAVYSVPGQEEKLIVQLAHALLFKVRQSASATVTTTVGEHGGWGGHGGHGGHGGLGTLPFWGGAGETQPCNGSWP